MAFCLIRRYTLSIGKKELTPYLTKRNCQSGQEEGSGLGRKEHLTSGQGGGTAEQTGTGSLDRKEEGTASLNRKDELPVRN